MSWCLAPRRVRRVHGTTGRVLWATAQQGGRGREPSTEHVLVPGTWSWPFKAGGTLMGRFRDALAAPGLGAIAEVKRRSPSAGDLRPDADAAALAKAFEESSAAAVSVLVDERFGGSFADLPASRAGRRAPRPSSRAPTPSASVPPSCVRTTRRRSSPSCSPARS